MSRPAEYRSWINPKWEGHPLSTNRIAPTSEQIQTLEKLGYRGVMPYNRQHAAHLVKKYKGQPGPVSVKADRKVCLASSENRIGKWQPSKSHIQHETGRNVRPDVAEPSTPENRPRSIQKTPLDEQRPDPDAAPPKRCGVDVLTTGERLDPEKAESSPMGCSAYVVPTL